MPHEHKHPLPQSGTRLTMVIALNLLITVVEVIGGLFSNSLSLISDAVHNLSDGLSVVIAWIAIYIGRKPANSRYTFGYKRAEVISATINAGTLLGISVYLCIEAINRLIHPQHVTGLVMTFVAITGLVANSLGTLLLREKSKENTNMHAVYLHLFSDALSSLAVVAGGLAIHYYRAMWVDPVLTFLIGVYILIQSLRILRRDMEMFMLAAPEGLSLDRIRKRILEIKGVTGVHHMHLWEVGERDIHLEAHIKVNTASIDETDRVRALIEQALSMEFHINHATLQMESQHTPCKTENIP